MHASLRAELAYSEHPSAENIRTVLVSPGQTATSLFDGMKTPSTFLAPVVEPVELAKEIVRAIDGGWSGEVCVPLYARWISLLAVLPVSIQRLVRYLSGLDRAMLRFSERKKAA
jgi:short-subunit dehydrogenase